MINTENIPDFSKLDGLIPAVVQDFATGRVLMVGFMNQEAWEKTITSGNVTFYSRTRQKLWTKGEESGNFLLVKDIRRDCDNDTLLVLAKPTGPVCHTGSETCFGNDHADRLSFLGDLQQLIHKRREEMPENSYTTKLFSRGINKIAQKVGEEAVELVIEAKDDNPELFLGEAADLVYHLLVLLSAKGFSLEEVIRVLEARHHK